MKVLCWIGLHQWQDWHVGLIGRQWCPRCGADATLYAGTRVLIKPKVWASESPQRFEERIDLEWRYVRSMIALEKIRIDSAERAKQLRALAARLREEARTTWSS